MTRESARPRTWLVVALVAVLGLAAWGGWGWWSSDGQVRHRLISSTEELPGVDAVETSRNPELIRVRMDADATPRQIVAVADRASDTGCCRLDVRLGHAHLYVDRHHSMPSHDTRAELLTLLGTVDFDGSIEVPSIGSRSLSLDPTDRHDVRGTCRATAEALRALDRATDETQFAIASLHAPVGRNPSAVIVTDVEDRDVRRRAASLLDLAASTDAVGGVEVTDDGSSSTVSTTVADLGEVQESWQRLARTVRPVRGASITLRVGDEDRALRITGPATASPARALQVVGAVRRVGGVASYVRSDLTAIGADVKDPAAAGRLARALQPLLPRGARLDATWGPLADQAAGNQIGDRVDVVADLAPRLAVLAKQGYAVGWELNGKYRRLVARPLEPYSGRLRGDPTALRREVTRIRAVDWPGEARIDLSMGASDAGGACENATRTVTFTSTADGAGREFKPYGCTDPEDVQAARRAWNSGR